MGNIAGEGIEKIFYVLSVAQLCELAAGEISQRYNRPAWFAQGGLYAFKYGGAFVLAADKRVTEIICIGRQGDIEPAVEKQLADAAAPGGLGRTIGKYAERLVVDAKVLIAAFDTRLGSGEKGRCFERPSFI